jgi:hypothetical protein
VWTGSPALRQWHIALADTCVHTAGCEQCKGAEGRTSARCQNGQALDRAEQTAYGEWVSSEYAGRAVQP